MNRLVLFSLLVLFFNQGISQNFCDDPPEYNDPASQDGILELMNIPCAWNLSNGNPSVGVAVVDQYFSTNNLDISGKVIDIYGGCNSGSNENNTHGTQSLGAVAAIRDNDRCVAGSGGDTRVAGFCCLGLGDPRDLLINEIEPRGYKIVTFSSCFGALSREVLEEVTSKGVVVLVAGLDDLHQSYQDVPGVIHVGRARKNGEWWPYGVGNENFDVLCVPDSIFRINPGLNGCGQAGGGTSIGTPIVAGVVALMRDVNPCLPPFAIEEILVNTAQAIPGNAEQGVTRGGIIDAYAAVSAALGNYGSDEVWSSMDDVELNDNYIMKNLLISPNTSITLDEDYFVSNGGKIVVSSGAELILSPGVVMSFGDDAEIIVKRGGRLIADGATLTVSYCGTEWKGVKVEGNRMSPQPIDPYGSLGAGEAGVAIFKNGAVVENAIIGVVNTNFEHPNPDILQYHGGLIIAEDAFFRNNKKAAAFYKYSSKLFNGFSVTDGSYFKNCEFDGHNTTVSIWATNGVTFDNCRFSNSTKRHIYAYNAAINVVNGCDFDCTNHTESSNSAIELFRSFPGSVGTSIGALNYAPNVFQGGFNGVYASGDVSLDKLSILQNFFLGQTFGTYISGSSSSSIVKNDYVYCRVGSGSEATGEVKNMVTDNSLSDSRVGIQVFYENQGYEFLRNCFLSRSKDMQLYGKDGGAPGIIKMHQGNQSFDAGNCFSCNEEEIFVCTYSGSELREEAEEFVYHIHHSIEDQFKACRNNIAYTGNRYDAQNLSDLECGSSSSPGILDISFYNCDIPEDKEELSFFRARLLLEIKELQEDLQGTVKYSEEWIRITLAIIQRKTCLEKVNKKLIKVKGDDREYDDLIAYFKDSPLVYRAMVFGQMMINEDYQEADNYLNRILQDGVYIDEVRYGKIGTNADQRTELERREAMDRAERERQDFVAIQRINIASLTQENFSLIPTDSIMLHDIGHKDHPTAGFARGLYMHLTGQRIVTLPQSEISSELRNISDAVVPVTIESSFSLSPNPNSTDECTISIDGDIEENYKIRIFSINGAVILEDMLQEGEKEKQLDISALPKGLSIVVLEDKKGKVMYREKLIKI